MTFQPEIKESDWKLLRKVHSVALERLCRRILSDIEDINADNAKSFHQRYLDIFELIQRRDKEIAQVFNDLRRSTALMSLAAIYGRGLLTENEFTEFSHETRDIVEVLLAGRRTQD